MAASIHILLSYQVSMTKLMCNSIYVIYIYIKCVCATKISGFFIQQVTSHYTGSLDFAVYSSAYHGRVTVCFRSQISPVDLLPQVFKKREGHVLCHGLHGYCSQWRQSDSCPCPRPQTKRNCSLVACVASHATFGQHIYKSQMTSTGSYVQEFCPNCHFN